MRKIALLAGALFLAGCGGEAVASDSTGFVCDDFAAFVKDGSPAHQRTQMVSEIGDLIGNADPKVQSAYETLTNTVDNPSAQTIADDTFAQSCFDAGWKG
jgi:hypothetical protein